MAVSRGHPRPAAGRHFLRSAGVAREIVASADVHAGDLVLEIGAGFGRLTAPLAQAGARVVAIEIDPDLARGLRRRFAAVQVVEADALTLAPPAEPHRVIGNLPFAITTPVLRSLFDDPGRPLLAADLIVQEGFARKRASTRPSTLLSLRWQPWWRLAAERRLAAASFDPAPRVDAAVLTVRRRRPALLDPSDAGAYRALLDAAFRTPGRPVRRSVPISGLAWKRLARGRGLRLDAGPRDLDVWDWVSLFALVRRG